jgi:hypothetical protein
MRRRWSLEVSAILAVIACESGSANEPEAPPPAPVPAYYANVKPILDQRCVGCHVVGGIGPFPLTTAEQARGVSSAIASAVNAKTNGTPPTNSTLCGSFVSRMPPWLAAPGCNTYQGDPSLTQDEIDTITSWAAHGAPIGDAAHPGPALPTDPTALSRVDLELEMKKPVKPT